MQVHSASIALEYSKRERIGIGLWITSLSVWYLARRRQIFRMKRNQCPVEFKPSMSMIQFGNQYASCLLLCVNTPFSIQ